MRRLRSLDARAASGKTALDAELKRDREAATAALERARRSADDVVGKAKRSRDDEHRRVAAKVGEVRSHLESCLRELGLAVPSDARHGEHVSRPGSPLDELQRLKAEAESAQRAAKHHKQAWDREKAIVWFVSLGLALGPYLAGYGAAAIGFLLFPTAPALWTYARLQAVSRQVASVRSAFRRAQAVGDVWIAEVDRRHEQLCSEAEGRARLATTSAEEKCRAAAGLAERRYFEQVKHLRTEVRADVASIKAEVAELDQGLSHASWQQACWRAWGPASEAAVSLRIGRLQVPTLGIHALLAEEPEMVELPALLPFRGGTSLLIKTRSEPQREAASAALRAFAMRLLATVPPSKLKFLFIDPLGLGESVAAFMKLQDYEESLVTGRAWAEPAQIEKCLTDITVHMEMVIQKYLRRDFTSIEDYNAKSGDVPEPYRAVVVFDFPAGFTETAASRLVSILRSGPRCGVYGFVAVDESRPLPHGFSLGELERHAHVIAGRDAKR